MPKGTNEDLAAMRTADARSGLRLSRACLPIAMLLGLGLGASPALAQDAGQKVPRNPVLPQIHLNAGIHRITAEVADSDGERQLGLMGRTKMGPNEGMLFVFEQPGPYCFWMRNTLIPLSIAFLSDEGDIVNVAEMEAGSEQNHCPARMVRFALEMNKGWFSRHGLKTGARIDGLRKVEAAR